jgi:protoheme IX farnesyltransferase
MQNNTSQSLVQSVKYFIELSKPRIAFFCILMTAGGIVLAQSGAGAPLHLYIYTLFGTLLTVASANTFNMIFEHKSDAFMKRTQFRPLVTGKIKVLYASIFAVVLGILGGVILAVYVNVITAMLALLAIFLYALVYTPLKKKTPLALVIGAVPGAVPPLLGWTAVTNQISLGGLAIFSILFAWQMPHFIAIAINHQEDYVHAGIRVVSAVRGVRVAKIQALLWSIVLFLVSLSLIPLSLGGIIYLVVASLLGAWLVYLSAYGLRVSDDDPQWPRRLFFASLVYLPILVLGLVLDRLLGW